MKTTASLRKRSRDTRGLIDVLENRLHLSATVWIDDALPPSAGAATAYENYSWVTSNPSPYSGTASLKADGGGGIYNLYNVWPPLKVGAGNRLFAYAYIDPANPPSELMLEFTTGSDNAHRAYFGSDDFSWIGTAGTYSKLRLGDIPFARNANNQPITGWVQLAIPAASIGLEDQYVNGVQLYHSGGTIAWDSIGLDALNVTAGLMSVNVSPPRQSFTFDDNPSDQVYPADLTLENLSTNTRIDSSALTTTFTRPLTGTVSWPGASGGSGVLTDGNYALTLSSTAIKTNAGKHLGGDVSINTWWLDADFNRDRTVSQADYNILISHYGMSNATFADGDANLDGQVDTVDFAHYFPPTAEPSPRRRPSPTT